MRPAALLCATVLALLPSIALAAALLAPPDAGIDGLMEAYDGQVPGAAVLVLHDGQPVFRRGYGLAVVEDGSAVTPASNFRLASVSKQFTAAAVLLLVEDGRLALDQPARRWLPGAKASRSSRANSASTSVSCTCRLSAGSIRSS